MFDATALVSFCFDITTYLPSLLYCQQTFSQDWAQNKNDSGHQEHVWVPIAKQQTEAVLVAQVVYPWNECVFGKCHVVFDFPRGSLGFVHLAALHRCAGHLPYKWSLMFVILHIMPYLLLNIVSLAYLLYYSLKSPVENVVSFCLFLPPVGLFCTQDLTWEGFMHGHCRFMSSGFF